MAIDPMDANDTAQQDGVADMSGPAHERVYLALRDHILYGGFKPGRPVTLRGLAEQLAVSPMPVREAVRRLIAEQALTLHDNRRVSVPAMTAARFEEIVFARQALEPELAARGLANISPQQLAAIEEIDERIDACMVRGDAEGYMRHNHRFHFAIYGCAASPMLTAMVASIWLQFGPFMRTVYGRFGTSNLVDQHQIAIEAIRAGSATELRAAILEDIMQGMRFIGEEALRPV